MRERSILVVDDDPSILEFYRKVFRSGRADDLDILGSPASSGNEEELRCRTFRDSRELLSWYVGALRSGDRSPLAILDVRMPGMDGLEAAQNLRDADPKIEIILCSAFSDHPISRMRDRLKGGFHFLRKPFPQDEFRLLVDTLCVSWERNRELEEHKQRLEEIIEATQVATWEWNVPTGDVAFNRRWSSMLGYSPEEIEPRIETWKRLCHPDDLPSSEAAVQRHFQGEDPFYDLECRLRHRDGHWIWVRYRGKVVERAPDGSPLRMSGTHSDVTDRRAMQEELVRSNRELQDALSRDHESARRAQEASRAKSEFLANMSHEIRTPLNGILGMVELLARTPLDEDQRRFAELIRSSGRSLLELISGILDFSKIEARKLEIEPVDFEPASMAKEVGAVFDLTARAKGLGFEVEIASGVAERAMADARRIRLFVVNLCGNAIKFTERGSVRLCMGPSRAFPGTDGLMVRVVDTGIGIDDAARERLFQPFTQADGSTSRRFGGTGLGLSISRQLAEAMGGRLDLESSGPEGSAFRLELPLAEPSDPAPEDRRQDPSTGAAEGMQILVVEDNPVNQLYVQGVLQAFGCVATLACDGREALKLLSERDFDLVLMDCQMPGMDGFEATARIRSAESSARDPAIPVVALTANAFAEDRELCRKAGMDDYLSKPIRPEDLLETVLRWAGSRFDAGRPEPPPPS